MLIGGLAGFLASLPLSMTLGFSGADLQPWIVGGIIFGAMLGVIATVKLGFGLPGVKLLQNKIGRWGLWGSVFGTVLGGILAVLLQLSLLSWVFAILGFNAGLALGHRIEILQERTVKQAH